ncbi:hypothetical protein D3C84_531750 [compost metagenome]
MPRQHLKGFAVMREESLHRQGNQYAIERTVSAALAQQRQQRGPTASVNVSIRLVEIASGGVDEHAAFGKVPIARTGTW